MTPLVAGGTVGSQVVKNYWSKVSRSKPEIAGSLYKVLGRSARSYTDFVEERAHYFPPQ